MLALPSHAPSAHPCCSGPCWGLSAAPKVRDVVSLVGKREGLRPILRTQPKGRWVGGRQGGLDDLRSEAPDETNRARSHERCARATALPGALGKLSNGVRFTGPIRHLPRWDTDKGIMRFGVDSESQAASRGLLAKADNEGHDLPLLSLLDPWPDET
jgi:hypothetical protein